MTIELEHVACPRCGRDESAIVCRGRDYILGLPGDYFVSSCAACQLWFQNPRPRREQLADLYPASYPNVLGRSEREDRTEALRAKTLGSVKDARDPSSGVLARVRTVLRQQSWLREIKRGWAFGYLVYGLNYRHLEPAPRLARLTGRVAAAVSSGLRWRAGVGLIPRFVPNGRLLEVGCGNGSHLRHLRELGWTDLHGVELSADGAAALCAIGFQVRAGTIEEALAEYPARHFDVIVSSMVLEHLLNPFETMRQLAGKLKPGGEMLFSTVIRDSLDGRLFGHYGVSYDFPRHMVFFQTRDLYQLLGDEFQSVRRYHHSTPIDFWRPACLRGRWIDRYIAWFFSLRAASIVVRILARLRLMGRVSMRARHTPAKAAA